MLRLIPSLRVPRAPWARLTDPRWDRREHH